MKIIGSGFIAKNLSFNKKKFKNHVLYARGVSNSLCLNNSDFTKDKKLLVSTINKTKSDKILVYISTCSITDPSRKNKKYVKFKQELEKIIIEKVKKYLIVRLPEVLGKNKNPHTVINFLMRKIKKSEKFNLWENASRNIIDVSDVKKILLCFLINKHKNQIINIANTKFYKITYIVQILEKILKKKAIFIEKKIGSSKWPVNLSKTKRSLKSSGIKFNKNYLERIIKKNLNN